VGLGSVRRADRATVFLAKAAEAGARFLQVVTSPIFSRYRVGRTPEGLPAEGTVEPRLQHSEGEGRGRARLVLEAAAAQEAGDLRAAATVAMVIMEVAVAAAPRLAAMAATADSVEEVARDGPAPSETRTVVTVVLEGAEELVRTGIWSATAIQVKAAGRGAVAQTIKTVAVVRASAARFSTTAAASA
jgi:hypothetical protein